MKTRKSVYLFAKIFLLTIVLLALSPIAAYSQFCTDVDQDGRFTILDVDYLYKYLFKGGPPLPDPWSANVDGFEKITLADWNYLFRIHFAAYGQPSCSVLYAPIVPIHDTAILISHTQWLDSGISEAVVIMEVSNNKTLTGISLVFDLYE